MSEQKKKKIAVISSRLKTIDDDAIEAEKWIEKYLILGYEVHLISGKIGEPTELPKLVIPEMDYKHSEARGVKRIMFANKLEKSGMKAANILLDALVNRIHSPLKRYISDNKIDIISVENVLGNLKNPALSIALTKVIKDSGLPTISRYHSFYWNEPYFEKNNNFPDLIKQNPPDLKNMTHITNSSFAQQALLERKKIKSMLIPNVIDIDHIQRLDDYNKDFREAFGIRDDQLIFLQPTRINRNKCIERSIKIVREMNEITKKDNVLMITGPPVYFRGNYFEDIVRKINKAKVNVILAHDRVFIARHNNKDQKFYSLNDAYLHADMVMFPSQSEDYGLPVLYAMAYKKPLFVNNYSNLKDILEKKPKFLLIDGKITNETISDVYEALHNKEKKEEMIEHNFRLLKENYSSDMLDDNIVPLLNKFEKKSFLKKLQTTFVKTKAKYNPFRKDDAKKPAPQKVTPLKKKEKKETLKNKKGGYKDPK
ncbi:glycosyltransferase family 4 protein [Thermoproteota archaeon]